MYKARKYRIYPNSSQKELIHKHCGNVRFLYNLALETKTMAYIGSKVNLSRYDLQKQIVDLKKELPWLKETNSQSLQVVLLDLDTAYSNFFKGHADFPKFKKKSNRGSFNVPQNVIVSDGNLIIPKFKEGIKINIHRDLVGVVKQATISFTPTGKYSVSILCDTEEDAPLKPKITEENSVGIDLGIKSFAITSEGEVIDNPKFLRNSIGRLKVLQRRASKKQKGSSNRQKANKRVSILHEKIANQRQDFLHKTSNKLIRENQTICLAEQEYINMLSNDTNDEIWKDIPKYDGKYQASNLGRIRCTPKVFKGKTKIIKTNYYIVKSSLSNEGYRRVALTNKQGDKRIMGVHRWIMFAFQGEVSEDAQVNHINGVRNDNRLCNLEYTTPRQNNNHRKILNPNRFTSKYSGVYGSNRKRGGAKYESSITFNGKNYYLGSSDDDYELSLSYKEALYSYENFGELPKPIEIKNRTSKIKGIGFHSLSGKYRVRYKEKYIGIFDTEGLAEKVYRMVEYLVDNRGIELNGELINKFRNKFAIDKRLK